MESDLPKGEDSGLSAEWSLARPGADSPAWVLLSLIAASFLGIGVFVGRVLVSNGSSSDIQPNTELAVPTTQRAALTTLSAVPITDLPVATTGLQAVPTTFPRALLEKSTVRLLPDSGELDGAVVLAEFASFGQLETVWVVEPGRLIARQDVPLAPGDWPHYLLFSGDHLAFSGPPDAYLLGGDLGNPAESVLAARYLIPGATHDLVWAVNDAIDAVTPINMVNGQVGNPVLLGDDAWWVSWAVGDGFLIRPKNEEAYGRYAYWTPNQELIPISLESQSGVHTAAGNIIVLVSPGSLISRLDTTTNTRVGVSVDSELGEGLVVDVCLSPDQQYAIVVGSTQDSVVIDFASAQVVAKFSVTLEFQAVGWTSNSELVFIEDGVLVAMDILSGERYEIAEIGSSRNWRLAGSAAMC